MDERFVLEGEGVVLDKETSLAWQRGASADRMVWKEGFSFIDQLNRSQYAGYSDWRYPSKEELASLILAEENRRTGLYISPLFETQRNCWAGTDAGHHKAYYADFYYGEIYTMEDNYANHFIRAVRTSEEKK